MVWTVLGWVTIFRISFEVIHNTVLALQVEIPLQVPHDLLLTWTQFLQLKDAVELACFVYLGINLCIVPALWGPGRSWPRGQWPVSRGTAWDHIGLILVDGRIALVIGDRAPTQTVLLCLYLGNTVFSVYNERFSWLLLLRYKESFAIKRVTWSVTWPEKHPPYLIYF